jgi:YHS domain-containing protein
VNEILRWLAALFTACSAVVAAQSDEPTVFPYDPVALIAGQVVEGNVNITVDRDRYRYVFDTPENKATFLTDPERYEIQFGGACARMGPLSGGGSVERFEVYDGRIYVFASNGCRETFRRHSERLVETDDPVPDVTPEQAARGRELLGLAVRAAGGAQAIDSIRTYREQATYQIDGNQQERMTLSVAFPDAFCRRLEWGESWWSASIAGQAGWLRDRSRDQAMVASQRRAFQREMNRLPLVILHARNIPGFVCGALGPGELNGVTVEKVAVALGGATSTLLIEPKTGTIRGMLYRGRGPSLLLGRLEIEFSDNQRTGAVTLPRTRQVKFDGDAAPSMSMSFEEIQIDPAFDAGAFVPSK